MRADTGSAAVRLSAQRALLGAIAPGVVGVCVQLIGDRLLFRAFVDAPLGVDEHEALEVAATEMAADFPAVADLEVEISERSSEPLRCPGDWVFLRYGVEGGQSR